MKNIQDREKSQLISECINLCFKLMNMSINTIRNSAMGKAKDHMFSKCRVEAN